MSRRLAGSASAVALLLTLSACGGGDGDGGAAAPSGADPSGPTAVTVSAIAVSAAAPLEVAQEQGFFEEEELEVTINYAEAPSMIPSVMSGDAQFAFLNAPAVLLARSGGVPAVAVAGIGAPPENAEDAYIQVLVGGDSDIQEPAHLEGRSVAVDTLYQLPDLSLRKALREEGVDTASIEFVEIPFPQMAEALQSGQVDAINASEPFVTLAQQAGARTLMSAFGGQDSDWPQSVMLSSEQYVQANQDVVDRFRRAVQSATEYSSENLDEVRALVPTFTQVPEPLAEQIRLPNFQFEFSQEGWEGWLEILEQEDLLQGEVQADEAFYSGE